MEAVKEGNLTALLLDMCELALCQVNSADTNGSTSVGQGSGLQQLQASLAALQAVLALKLPSSPLTVDFGCDLMLMLTDAAQVTFAPIRELCNAIVSVLQCKQYCQDTAVLLASGDSLTQSNPLHNLDQYLPR